MEKIQQKSFDNENLTIQYENLIRKIDDTRRSRFHMANRLKKEHEWRNKLLLFYNMIIIILSILTLYNYYTVNVPMASYVILAFSISLSLYSTHLGGTSRMETAGIMRQNANALSSILSSVQFSQSEVCHTIQHLDKIRYYTKKYESTINNVENHSDIDYMYEKLKSKDKKNKTIVVQTLDQPLHEKKYEQEVPQHNSHENNNLSSNKGIEEMYNKYSIITSNYEKQERNKRLIGYLGAILIAIVILIFPLIENIFIHENDTIVAIFFNLL
ncbi:SLATT domain-containing protein [Exiguobacterium sp. SH0S2]|uniref:SLATT domain-containing protein n=1 Tax=Exiguobacterium sp. SH0S2 TaxID=2510950 RepID=UPI00103E3FBF|nr:SLATT domain-containing protein [Exiguobacterium sp. SH0S2]TCI62860.1 SLATT domain-containing protein [Exiguobacterium sp. SH0S2]